MFKGIGQLANLGSLVKHAQQMEEKLRNLNQELKSKRVTGSGGGGLVRVESNGLGEVLAVTIDPSLMEKQDREMIEDLLPMAFNQASQRAKEMHQEAVKSLTEGLDVPGLSSLLEKMPRVDS